MREEEGWMMVGDGGEKKERRRQGAENLGNFGDNGGGL